MGNDIDRLLDKTISKEREIDKSEKVELFKFYYEKCLTNTTVTYNGVVEMLEALKSKKSDFIK